MNSKVLKFQIFCLILLSNLNVIFGFKCKFVNQHYENGQKYICEITTNSNIAEESHLPNKTDADVKEIEISKIQHLNLTEFPFCERFKSLDSLEILGANYIDENLLQKCENLQSIRLRNGDMKEISEKLFSGNSKLTLLVLDYIKLKALPENIFSNLKNLRSLSFSSNEQSYLPPNVFKPLENLKILTLSGNDFESINPAWFESLQKLLFLDLKFNKISDLPKNSFKPLKNLQHLWLWANELTVIHADSFGTLDNLENIDLKQNKINAIDEKFIDNVEVFSLDMGISNICYRAKITKRGEMKQKLKKCFQNYRPRKEAYSSCGKPKTGQETILSGTQVERGFYPWNAALVKTDGEYFCGGTLVSNKTIVTAAHCMTGKSGNHKFGIADVLVQLGVHDLKKPEHSKVTVAVKSIHVHSDWNPHVSSFDADIAVLELVDEVQFNDFIQPICLMEPDSEESRITSGKIVGFGKSESTDVERVVTSPIIDYQTCSKNKNLESLVSSRTICSGYAKGIGPCKGESGIGLIVYRNGNFFLRGVVSASHRDIVNDCKVDEHTVLADVLKFTSYIKSGGLKEWEDEVRMLKAENKKFKAALDKKNDSWLCKFA